MSDDPVHVPHAAPRSRHVPRWCLIAATICVFAALIAVVSVIRSAHVAEFIAGQHYLTASLGALALLALLGGSFAMILAGWCLRLQWCGAAILLLLMTLGCGATFLGIKGLEYQSHWSAGLNVAQFFHPQEAFFAALHAHPNKSAPTTAKPQAPAKPVVVAVKAADAIKGRALYLGTCASCHGSTGAGLPNLGADLRDSSFISGKTDVQLLSFVKVGRQPWDSDSKLKLAMPGRGGNPSLSDDKLRDIIAYVRELQMQAREQKQAATPIASSQQKHDAVQSTASDTRIAESAPDDSIPLPPLGTFLPPPGVAPQGWAQNVLYQLDHPIGTFDATPRAGVNAAQIRLFFGIFLAVISVHGLFVLIGMLMVTVLMLRIRRKPDTSHLADSLEISGYYWHLLSVIWLVLFPLFYLMR
ncbi:MAG: c-type cytochrome [Phycisphaerales bacterium]